jgi:hypothetical protein
MNYAITTLFMNALSIFIPFFERSVSETLRANIDVIANKVLKNQVRTMIKQEALTGGNLLPTHLSKQVRGTNIGIAENYQQKSTP